MKKVLFPILALVLVLGLSLPATAAIVNTTTVDLIMDGGDTCTVIGDVTINYYDDGTFTVIYNITGPAIISLDETHVYLDLVAGPTKHSPGKFPYMAGEVIDLGVVYEGNIVYIAAHAEVTWDTGEVDEALEPIYESETGWAQSGDDILIREKKNWATYFEWVPMPTIP